MLRLLCLVFCLVAMSPSASAQFGIGGLIGDPTGLTVKLGGGRGGVAVNVGLGSDLSVQAHYLFRESRINGTGADVRFLFGGGGFFRDSEPDARAGVSALFGLSWYVVREAEVFGQITPGIRLTPNTDGQVGAAVGLRFYP